MFEVSRRSSGQVSTSSSFGDFGNGLLHNSYWGAFWIDCGSHSSALESFQRIGYLCGVHEPEIASVKDYLSSTTRTWILVVDNADDPAVDYSNYFPSGQSGNIILTTRDQELASTYATVGSKVLDQLPKDLAETLLLRAAGVSETTWSEKLECGAKIAHELGHHTLALVHAGAFIKECCPLEQYLDLHRKRKDHLFNFYNKQEQSTYKTVYNTFEVSAERLQDMQREGQTSAADALDLLNLLAFMHREGSIENIFKRAKQIASILPHEHDYAAPPFTSLWQYHANLLPMWMPREDNNAETLLRWRQACHLLRTFHLITTNDREDNSTLSMHPLVHVWAQERQNLESQCWSWLKAASTVALTRERLLSDLYWYDDVRLHFLAFAQGDIRKFTDRLPLKNTTAVVLELAWMAYVFVESASSEYLLDLVFEYEKLAGANENDIILLEAEVLNALNLKRKGDLTKSACVLEKLLLIAEKSLDQEHMLRQQIQFCLAEIYVQDGQATDAIDLLRPTIDALDDTRFGEDPSSDFMRYKLAYAYIENGQTEDTTSLLHDLANIQEKKKHPEEGDLRLLIPTGLGHAYLRNGQAGECIAIIEPIVRLQEKELHSKAPLRLYTEDLLAVAYITSGKLEDAIYLLEHVVDIKAKARSISNASRLGSLRHLHEAYTLAGRPEEAEETETIIKEVEMLAKKVIG